MVKSKLFVITSIIFLLIPSCSNVATSTNNNIESTATIQVSTSTPTNTPTLAPTEIVSTLTPSPPESILKFQPFEIKTELPSDVKPNGKLALWTESDTLQLIRFNPQVKVETNSSINPESTCLATSPDGNWLSHCNFSDDSPTGEWLYIESADWQQQKKIPMNTYLFDGSHLWLDNQQLIFTSLRNKDRPAGYGYPVVVINPFTKKQIELESHYPEFQHFLAGPAGTMDFSQSDAVYDPSLNLVIFPSTIGGSYIVLWDRQANSMLAKVDRAVGYYPLWSPDVEQFVVPLLSPKESENVVEEWFRVTRDGQQVEQLTHFGDYFMTAEMGGVYQWSPDSQKLAFWIDVTPSLCSGMNLAILDIHTKQVIDTCIFSEYYQSPIWSLDSRYVSVLSVSHTSQQTILIDTSEDQAFDITNLTGGSRPIGWMVSP